MLSCVTSVLGYVLVAGIDARKSDNRIDDRLQTSFRPSHWRGEKSIGWYVHETAVDHPKAGMVKQSGFGLPTLPPHRRRITVPDVYRPLDEINRQVQGLQQRYQDIISVEEVGRTTALDQPIWGIKVSDNVRTREDEPRILFVGVHHAREPIGSKICIEIAGRLGRGYGSNAKITKWVNSLEIWLIPVMNPDGYQYIIENNLTFPWWRKNLRDNDGDGVFNPLYDGVDLNRNYDYNWQEGGDGKKSSWFFRGESPFSEGETQAIMNLALRENFTIGISYHSYGESILFPWGNYKRPPDLELIVEIASDMASKITKESGRGTYSILPLNGRVGQSSIWMYGNLRVIDFIVEVGTEYFPAVENVPFILKENIEGAFYLFDRLLGDGIKGHVFDSRTGEPLLADIEILELTSSHVRPRKTNARFGSFHRLLKPGRFTLFVSSPGYRSKTIKNIRVGKGRMVSVEVGLEREQGDFINRTTSK
ncbi:hypothetical protein MJD09_19390 [bacterium]|nr:hypothetical protein [bacterium]